ncbi:uncharacterized protein LOC132611280 [Lycium barbarum]|uniref:uncharacterized protein LOC132611280 n=1 Tax=Lycium barbarum TaxID=112863 RepID=UPI00293E282B|nr:uncharacterized protein LOC132611280 [Lycium barbarum]
MKDSDSVKEYSSKLMEIVNQIRILGEDFPDQKCQDPARGRNGQKKNQSDHSSQRANFTDDHQVEKSEKEVFIASHISHVDGCNLYVDSVCTRHMEIDENLFVTLDRTDRTKVKLGNGALYGHIERNRRQKKNQSDHSSQRANFTDDHQVEKSEKEVFIASHISHVDGCNLYVDSACTRHMEIDENLFVTLDRTDRTKVKLGNGALVHAKGRGSVKFPTDEGMKIISDVLYCNTL